jgi:hypothetical protein
MLRHIVLWSMKDDAERSLDELLDDLRALVDDIDEIKALSCGPLINDAPHDAALCVDLRDEDALARYRAHPAHQPVLQALRVNGENLVVGDYTFPD